MFLTWWRTLDKAELFECSDEWCRWCWFSVFCSPIALYRLAQKLKMSYPVARFIGLGFLTYLFVGLSGLFLVLRQNQAKFEHQKLSKFKEMWRSTFWKFFSKINIQKVSLDVITDFTNSLSIFFVIVWFLQKIALRREFNRQLGEFTF